MYRFARVGPILHVEHYMSNMYVSDSDFDRKTEVTEADQSVPATIPLASQQKPHVANLHHWLELGLADLKQKSKA